MKNIFLIIITIVIFGCSPKITSFETSEVNFISKETNGTITLKSLGYGNNLETAVRNAQIKCLDAFWRPCSFEALTTRLRPTPSRRSPSATTWHTSASTPPAWGAAFTRW